MSAKCAVITGASRGIGLATALRLGTAGYSVVVAARHEDKLEQALEQIGATGATCAAVTGDVAEPAQAEQIIAAAVERFGRVDVLVNNAGCAPLDPIEQFRTEEFERVAAVNMAAVFHTTRAVWPVMKRQGGGTIVNISSVASVDPFPGFAVYGASKAWVNLFTQATAEEGKPHGIRVFAVAPGAVETQMMRAAFPDFPAEQTLAPDDVAAVIESLCEPRLARVSGQTIFVRK
jgi:NAD(P)-dependent dehydrogenase (short-subunit alcohol dehydrogenase family)